MDEKEQLRGFILTVLDYVELPVPESALDPIRKSNQLRGLRAAATDMVEMCQDVDLQQVTKLDRRLLEQGLPSLSEMRDQSLRLFRSILSRNQIKTDDEWRLVESYISDVDSDTLTERDREHASSLLTDYEPI